MKNIAAEIGTAKRLKDRVSYYTANMACYRHSRTQSRHRGDYWFNSLLKAHKKLEALKKRHPHMDWR